MGESTTGGSGLLNVCRKLNTGAGVGEGERNELRVLDTALMVDARPESVTGSCVCVIGMGMVMDM